MQKYSHSQPIKEVCRNKINMGQTHRHGKLFTNTTFNSFTIKFTIL